MRARTAFVFLATLFLVFGTCISFETLKLIWESGNDSEVTRYLPKHDSTARMGVYTSSETWGTVLALNNPFPIDAHVGVYLDGYLVDFRRIEYPTKHLVLKPIDRTIRLLEIPRGSAPSQIQVEWTVAAPTINYVKYEGELSKPHDI